MSTRARMLTWAALDRAEQRVADLEAGIRREHHTRRVQVGSEPHGGPPQYADRCVCGKHPCALRALVGDTREDAP